MPGLLEGAHAGVGLGHQFLRHCQRCRVLVHVVDGTSPDPLGDYFAIRQELELFNPRLAAKPSVVAYNKTDVPDSGDYWDDIRAALLATVRGGRGCGSNWEAVQGWGALCVRRGRQAEAGGVVLEPLAAAPSLHGD